MIETDVHPDGRTDVRSDAEKYVADYIELLAHHLDGHGFARLRRQGRFWEPQTLPLAYSYGRYGDCFRNATQLALGHQGLHYCEGYAFHGIITTHHAWCVDDRGRVVDRTWRIKPRGRLYAVDASDAAYFGIRFSKDELQRSLLATGMCGLLFRGPV